MPIFHPSNKNGGFTIVELMIATLVFSTILVVVTTGIIRFSNDYYRGTVAASTQDTARNIIDTVSQAVQFSTSSVSDNGAGQLCAGGYLFEYAKGVVVTPSTGGITMKRLNDSSNCDSGAVAEAIQKLIPEGMRLVRFSVTETDDQYTISVGVSKGDADLFCVNTDATCAVKTDDEIQSAISSGDTLTCRRGSGSQFCYVAYLETLVTKRMK
jgi:type II secretory pathway pseudopilin PulG